MADGRIVRDWTRWLIAAALAVVAAAAPGAASEVGSACCLPEGGCQVLGPTLCEVQRGGVSKPIGTSCADAMCPEPCSAVSSPECNGVCPPGETCVLPANGAQAGATTNALALCFCVEEIPEGGACAQQPDACAPGLSCQNGICLPPPAPAPALSMVGLALAVVSLVALAFARRRRHG